MKILISALLLLASCLGADANGWMYKRGNAAPIPPVADAYWAASGVDSPGNVIGTDCTYAAPCRTIDKLLTFQAAQVASNPARSYKYVLLSSFGSYAIDTVKLYNSTHTVNAGYTTTVQGWPGLAPLDAGVDTAGTWSVTTIPNGSGTAGCVSNALAAYAPLVDGTTTTTADRYIGDMWIGSRRVQATIWPRIGDQPDYVGPLLTAGTATGSYTQGSPNATLTNGSANITVSDLSQVGIVGDTVGFQTALGGFNAQTRYWILTKSAATGSGTITTSATPGGAAKSASAGGSFVMTARTLPNNTGQRISTIGDFNTFPVNAGYNSAYSDGKVWLHSPQGSGSSLIPIASATSTQVTLQSSAFTSGNTNWMRAGQRLRRWNVFEDLGTGGAKGELYTNRTSGLIYYVPISGEVCSDLNVAGRAIIPGRAESILRISSATADGSVSGSPVGNLILTNLAFRHTNTSVWTGRHNISGNVGGYIGGGNSFQMFTLDPAVAMVGANNVTISYSELTQLGGSGVAMGWGTNNSTVTRSLIKDLGGAGVMGGGDFTFPDSYRFNSDPGFIGTRAFGPTTPSFNQGGSAFNKDLTGASDCCQTITNNKIQEVGKTHTGSACIVGPLWQNYDVENNLISDCPNGAIQQTSITAGSASTPGWANGTYPGIYIAQSFGSTIQNNILSYTGFGFALDGTRVPGANMASDFGALYLQCGQDGPGDGSVPRLLVAGNLVSNISTSPYSFYNISGVLQSRGFDAILDYHDGNCTNGINQWNNMFWSVPTVDSRTVYPSRMTQHTGDLRVQYRNNIFASTFPPGSTVPSLYAPRADVGPYPYLPLRSQAYTCSGGSPCFVINVNNLYKATASGTSGAGATAPTCGSGTCATDGTMVWTFDRAMPGVNATDEQSTITAWVVTGGASADYPQRGAIATNPQFTNPNNNLFWQSGQTMTNYSNSSGTVSWASWQAAGKDVNSLWNSDPNFVDMTGGSGWLSFKFKPSGTGSACSGTGGVSPACSVGFIPFDFSGAGPNW